MDWLRVLADDAGGPGRGRSGRAGRWCRRRGWRGHLLLPRWSSRGQARPGRRWWDLHPGLCQRGLQLLDVVIFPGHELLQLAHPIFQGLLPSKRHARGMPDHRSYCSWHARGHRRMDGRSSRCEGSYGPGRHHRRCERCRRDSGRAPRDSGSAPLGRWRSCCDDEATILASGVRVACRVRRSAHIGGLASYPLPLGGRGQGVVRDRGDQHLPQPDTLQG
mmetsp:Transcript_51843/g.110869  ORF Transcript_51843/g.110869 Transcript_51843/m.110869 type:complete len:219 (-) Transcript_51843:122-778(-)